MEYGNEWASTTGVSSIYSKSTHRPTYHLHTPFYYSETLWKISRQNLNSSNYIGFLIWTTQTSHFGIAYVSPSFILGPTLPSPLPLPAESFSLVHSTLLHTHLIFVCFFLLTSSAMKSCQKIRDFSPFLSKFSFHLYFFFPSNFVNSYWRPSGFLKSSQDVTATDVIRSYGWRCQENWYPCECCTDWLNWSHELEGKIGNEFDHPG